MANKKFSEFVLKTSTSDVSHIVGYNGAENVQITPANFVTGGGTGVFLPLAGGNMTGNTTHNDNVRAQFGASSDLQIYHDSNVSFIRDDGTGGFFFTTNGDAMHFQDNTGEWMAKFVKDAAVELYYDNSKKFETTSSGISVTGDALIDNGLISTLDSTGSLYIDINHNNAYGGRNFRVSNNGVNFFNIDANALATFAGNVTVTGDGTFTGNITIGSQKFLKFGGNGARIYGDNANSLLTFDTNSLERMRLDGSGNLGLGTSSPLSFGTGSHLVTAQGEAGNNYGGFIARTDNVTGQMWATEGGANVVIGSRTDHPLLFSINNAEKMRLDTLGNLAIGSTSSSERLKVSGQQHLLQLTRGGATDSKWFFSADSSKLYIAEDTVDASNIKLTLQDNGNFGIGTVSPDAKLSIARSSNAINTEISFKDAGGSRAGVIGMEGATTNDMLLSTLGGIRFFTASNVAVGSLPSNERMRLDSSGNLLVGKTAVSIATVGAEFRSGGQSLFTCDGDAPLNPNRLTSDGIIMYLRKDGTVVGTISVTGSATAYNTSSDYRLKEDLQDFEGLDLVSKIPVYDYKWKADKSRSYGVMAHELEEVLPQAVSGEKDAEEMQSVDYSKIVPLLVKSIQELSAKLEALECQCEKK